jgi:hypothetical protein
MNWMKIFMKATAILAVSLSPALNASESPAHRIAPPCSHTIALNEGRHRRRVWQQATRAALEKPVASTASLGMP